MSNSDEEWNYLLSWHWDPSKLKPLPPQSKKQLRTMWDLYMERKKETWDERIKRMLMPMSSTVCACSMCHLGRQVCTDHDTTFDPHVFSNCVPSKWMVVGQNPGFKEVLQGEPFVGDAGKNFNERLVKNGLSRDKFYISNIIKCYTKGNEKPNLEEVSACEPILRMELNLLKPKLVIALGAVAFGAFCPDIGLTENLGTIVKSNKFNVQVYPVYHPSPRNLSDPGRLKKFNDDIDVLCELIKRADKL